MEGQRVERDLLLLCYIFLRVACALAFLCSSFCVWRACSWKAFCCYCVIFYACGGTTRGTHLLLLYYIFCTWNALCSSCVIFSASGGPVHGSRYGVIVLYFPHVEHALALLCYIFLLVERALALLRYIFCVWNTL